jgi:hypothetical protein
LVAGSNPARGVFHAAASGLRFFAGRQAAGITTINSEEKLKNQNRLRRAWQCMAMAVASGDGRQHWDLGRIAHAFPPPQPAIGRASQHSAAQNGLRFVVSKPAGAVTMPFLPFSGSD